MNEYVNNLIRDLAASTCSKNECKNAIKEIYKKGGSKDNLIDAAVFYENMNLLSQLITDKNTANTALAATLDHNKINNLITTAKIAKEWIKEAAGRTLYKALLDENVSFYKPLLNVGADINVSAKLAVIFDKQDLFVSLINLGANPDQILLETVQFEKLAMFTSLIKLGADVNNGLISAIFLNKPTLIKTLVDMGADVDAGLEYAKNNHKTDMFKPLIEAKGYTYMGFNTIISHNNEYISDEPATIDQDSNSINFKYNNTVAWDY